jgi:hypothetical protein
MNAMTSRFRCSLAGDGQSMVGSAAHDSGFLLIEHPGPWGRKALEESRWLAPEVRAAVAERAEAAGLRVQLIRRVGASEGRTMPASFAVYVARTDPARQSAPWIARTTLTDPLELVDLPLAELAADRSDGLPAGWRSEAGPLFLVCTNGRRDVCCAERGRPAAAALAAEHPEATWETTHLGGHRFAGAVLVLPSGLAYGRVDAGSARHIAAATYDGRLVRAHLRGRTAYDGAVQAAEIALLEQLDLDAVDALTLVGAAVRDGHTDVTFLSDAGEHTVKVIAVPEPPMRQSCADEVEKAAISYRVG